MYFELIVMSEKMVYYQIVILTDNVQFESLLNRNLWYWFRSDMDN